MTLEVRVMIDALIVFPLSLSCFLSTSVMLIFCFLPLCPVFLYFLSYRCLLLFNIPVPPRICSSKRIDILSNAIS